MEIGCWIPNCEFGRLVAFGHQREQSLTHSLTTRPSEVRTRPFRLIDPPLSLVGHLPVCRRRFEPEIPRMRSAKTDFSNGLRPDAKMELGLFAWGTRWLNGNRGFKGENRNDTLVSELTYDIGGLKRPSMEEWKVFDTLKSGNKPNWFFPQERSKHHPEYRIRLA